MSRTRKDSPYWVQVQNAVKANRFEMVHLCGRFSQPKTDFFIRALHSETFLKCDLSGIKEFEAKFSSLPDFSHFVKEEIPSQLVINLFGPYYTQKKVVIRVFVKKEVKRSFECTPLEFYDFKRDEDKRNGKMALCYPIPNYDFFPQAYSYRKLQKRVPQRGVMNSALRSARDAYNSELDLEFAEENVEAYFNRKQKSKFIFD